MNVEQVIESQMRDMSDIEAQVYLINLQLNLMDAILEKKMDEGKIVFSEVEHGLLN